MNSVVWVVMAVLVALNVATLWYQIRQDKKHGADEREVLRSLAQSVRQEDEEAEAANTGEPQGSSRQGVGGQRQNPLGVAVVAPDYRMGLLLCERLDLDPRRTPICTQVEHMRGRELDICHVYDSGWDGNRRKRGELTMYAEMCTTRRKGRVYYHPELF